MKEDIDARLLARIESLERRDSDGLICSAELFIDFQTFTFCSRTNEHDGAHSDGKSVWQDSDCY